MSAHPRLRDAEMPYTDAVFSRDPRPVYHSVPDHPTASPYEDVVRPFGLDPYPATDPHRTRSAPATDDGRRYRDRDGHRYDYDRHDHDRHDHDRHDHDRHDHDRHDHDRYDDRGGEWSGDGYASATSRPEAPSRRDARPRPQEPAWRQAPPRGPQPRRGDPAGDRRAGRSPVLLRSTVAAGLVVAAGVSVIRVGDEPDPGGQLALARTSVTEPAAAGVTSCRAQYEVTSKSVGRFTAVLTVTNTGSTPVNGWTLRWRYPGANADTPAPRLGDGWNATVSSDASGTGTATSGEGSRVIPAGASTTIGFVGTSSGGALAEPTGFTLNGKACR
jgi:hypothetical protein